jgi:hypothetical protein
MATQAMACPIALADHHRNVQKPCQVIGKLPQQLDNAPLVSNMRIAIAAKVLVQFKNLLKLKGSPGQCLNDAETSQHLPLSCRLLCVVHCYIVHQSL